MSNKNIDKIRVKYSIDTFRKDFNKLFPEFYLRIRANDEENDIKEDDKYDIAYYAGNKAFIVSEDEESNEYILIGFPINTYKCNTSSVTNNLDNTFMDSLISICEKMEKFFWFVMPEIKYEFASSVLKNNNFDENRFIKFEEDVKKINPNIIINRDDVNCRYTFENFNGVSDIIKVQYSFIKNIRLTDGKAMHNSIKNVDFDEFKVIAKTDDISIDDITSLENPESFINVVRDAISSYKGKEELEKKYQHQFLLYGNKTNLFSDTNSTVLPFEQEYYIIQESKSKYNGRIDCIFYGYKDNLLTDIYLIEIKVDDSVLGLGNGIHKHLIDIYYLKDKYLNNEDKNYGKTFFKNLISRINTRRDILGDNKLVVSEKLEVHFYTVIGLCAVSKDDIHSYLNNLNDINSSEYKGVLDEINDYYLSDIHPLKDYFNGNNKYFTSLANDFDIKLYVSENIWNCNDKEFNQEYIEKTGEYFYNE